LLISRKSQIRLKTQIRRGRNLIPVMAKLMTKERKRRKTMGSRFQLPTFMNHLRVDTMISTRIQGRKD
jgi:hypothetical protein